MDSLTQEKERLSKERTNLQEKIKTLEEAIRSKCLVIPDTASLRPKLSFALRRVNLTLPSDRSPPPKRTAVQSQQKKASEAQIMEPTNFYKDCMLASNGMLYEDDALKIALIRSINTDKKTATLKLNFFNKSKDTTLIVQQFSPISYNKLGNTNIL